MSETLASQFFDALPADNAAAFARLSKIVEARSLLAESEWIDYKSGYVADHEATGETFSKALSGFGNSGGGILLWGIKTERMDNHDVPSSLVLVDKPSSLEGRLKEWLATACDPPVLNVKFRSIPNEEDKGFVVVFIPESGLKPHQALKGSSKYRFYLRAGHQHQPASQALLRQLFHPNTKPIFQLEAIPIPNPAKVVDRFTCRLLNRGLITVDDLFIIVKNPDYFQDFEPTNVTTLQTFRPHGRELKEMRLTVNNKIHPSMGVDLFWTNLFLGQTVEVLLFGRNLDPVLWRIGRKMIERAPIEVEGPNLIRSY